LEVKNWILICAIHSQKLLGSIFGQSTQDFDFERVLSLEVPLAWPVQEYENVI